MRLIDADVLPEISLFGTTEYINVKNAPTIQAILLDKVKQAREEIEKLDLNDYGDNLYQFQAKCTEILDKLIESEDKE